MIDRTTKLLLAAIAVGLFFNAAVPLIQPTEVMAEEAQRGPRGGGAVQPQVQGNVQSQAQQQAQAAREERERELNNPGTDTDTDKWLRLIYISIDEIEGSLGYANREAGTISVAESDIASGLKSINERLSVLEDIRSEVRAIDNGLCGSGQTYNRVDC